MLVYLLIKNEAVFVSGSGKTTADAIHTQSTVRTIGVALMSEYVLVFEAAGILLLMALIGAAFIAGRKTF